MMVYGQPRAPLQELPAEPVPTGRIIGNDRAALSQVREAPGRGAAGRVEPLTLQAARTRHSELLAALRAAEVHLSECRRRGDVWTAQRAVWALETAQRAYSAADSWLVSVLLGKVS